jgi:hypothetical protein
MMDAIEDLDDIQMATANFEISEETLSMLYAEQPK